jgi:hypothetical protein
MYELEMNRLELDNWKRIALYLADCHAATAEDMAERKSGSKSDRDRFASICENAISLLKDPTMIRHLPRVLIVEQIDEVSKRVIDRCHDGAKRIRERDKKGN